MRISTRARYALRALCHVANRGYSSAQVIAENQRIPPRYLEEIIADLRKAGFVVGKRGPRGGYQLARPAAEIAIAEVLGAVSHDSDSALEAGDEIARLAEQLVLDRLRQALEGVDLAQLVEQAKASYRRSAADYVI